MRNENIYFPFAEYEREMHALDSCYQVWQLGCIIYDNSGKVCAASYQTAKPYLKHPINWMWYLIDAPAEYLRRREK